MCEHKCVLAVLLGWRALSTWEETCWWKLWECEIVQASWCYLHSLRTDWSFYQWRKTFLLGIAFPHILTSVSSVSVINPLMCSDPRWISHKKRVSMWCFSKRKQCFCVWRASSEKITFSIVQSCIPNPISESYFLLWGQFSWESRGPGFWQRAKWEPVITTAEECVFVSEYALKSKINMSHWTTAVVFKTYTCMYSTLCHIWVQTHRECLFIIICCLLPLLNLLSAGMS